MRTDSQHNWNMDKNAIDECCVLTAKTSGTYLGHSQVYNQQNLCNDSQHTWQQRVGRQSRRFLVMHRQTAHAPQTQRHTRPSLNTIAHTNQACKRVAYQAMLECLTESQPCKDSKQAKFPDAASYTFKPAHRMQINLTTLLQACIVKRCMPVR